MMRLATHRALRFFTCEEGDVPHGFFTRHGGVSRGVYRGLNVGSGSKDDPADVRHNQALALEAFGGERLYTLYQHHSADVISVPFGENVERTQDRRVKGDALVAAADDFAQEAEVRLGVMTADCVPVLLFDSHARVIAAAHAGWKGALDGILGNTIEMMRQKGAKNESIYAAIGPAIAQESYQVGAEFRAAFLNQDAQYQDFFRQSDESAKYQFDLPAFVRHRLLQAGVSAEHIAQAGVDTYADEESFFSYRRSCHRGESDYGRNLSIIGF